MSLRAGKVGDQFQIEKKLEARYDKEEELGTPKAVMAWVNVALAGEAGFTALADFSWKGIQDFLKDGVVLCKLINKCLSAAGMETVSYKANAKMAFVQMANVEGFNKACERYGVPAEALFQTCDVMEGRKGPMINVVNCLNNLGFTANGKNFTPKYEAPAAPKADF